MTDPNTSPTIFSADGVSVSFDPEHPGYVTLRQFSGDMSAPEYEQLEAACAALNTPASFVTLPAIENEGRLFCMETLTLPQAEGLMRASLRYQANALRKQVLEQQKLRGELSPLFGDSDEITRKDETTLDEADRLERQAALPVEELLDTGEEYGWAVYSNRFGFQFFWGTMDLVIRQVFRVKIHYRKVRANRRKLSFDVNICVANSYGLDIGACMLQVGDLTTEPFTLPMENKLIDDGQLLKSKYRKVLSMPMDAILNEASKEGGKIQLTGNACALLFHVNGRLVRYRLVDKPITKRTSKFSRKVDAREVWVPSCSFYDRGYAIHVRRGFSGVYVLYLRPMEEVEHKLWFRFMESAFISGLLFHLGRMLNHVPGRKKVALFNEKYSEKAEEGVFQLFQLCRKSKKTRCYFIIDAHSPDYPAIASEKGVVKKYSLLYYWLLFNVNFFISSEAPSHLSMMNSNNRYLRWTFIRHPFIFLQHGVTYLKRHDKRSTYVKGKAGQVSYVIVNSEKERQIVSEMLQIPPSKVWNTGMLIFDRIAYKHLNQSSEDKVTVMLTWKQDEELLDNYEDSTYFQFNMRLYNLLLKYVDRSQINIVAHPRAYELLKSTSLGDLLWDKPISQVLEQSKLLITDYSSVCWNSFYQGGGVVFFQPDLSKYEDFVGKLIPRPEEYIGQRVFDFDALDALLSQGIHNGVIDLGFFRSKKNEEMYRTINEHWDGKNTQRVYQALKNNNII